MTGNEKHGLIIQERDNELFRELAVMRIADREQLKCAAGFDSRTRVNRRLLALTRAGLLRRYFLGVDGVGQKALYTLSRKGASLVEVPCRGLRRSKDEVLVADFFVIHQLRVNELYCTLKHHTIPVEGTKFARWESFHKPIDTAKSLIPDGYVEIARGNAVMPAFLEVDLGHERGSVWPKKVENYVQYAMSGEFARHFVKPQFRTLVVANSERRMQSLRASTAKVTNKIFWFTTFDSIADGGFWSPVWLRPSDGARLPLL
jgi:hypothetical protein